MVKLKRCKCGGECELYNGDWHNDLWRVICTICGEESLGFANKRELIRRWNINTEKKTDKCKHDYRSDGRSYCYCIKCNKNKYGDIK